ncbi:hypothetical protein ACVI1K_007722 [Bradyrhizobium sp. USDA 4508]
MTGDQARRLKLGDYVCWRRQQCGSLWRCHPVGERQQTSPLFNDMRLVSQTDLNGCVNPG